ncbi:molybdopterin converting factor subunit 1 [Thiolapillus brandeum]|uniref:Molybdopterin synthase sulfur carrier subunit n=1 Tax=Thiolapillus brandeum TaxID=1076588 RepID=A0A7U6JHC8_9GAMM|nr:molybdopterin converting factor subunit 1 [Thiolapillus brandeum]BAO43075.1 molybdenum cofactor biosynthesis protein D [Thiolapillus brandeum]
MIRLLYFASLKERLGSEGESLPADGIQTLGDLKNQLTRRGGVWKEVFSGDERVLGAVNQEMAQDDSRVKDGDEVGFFPPVTGG